MSDYKIEDGIVIFGNRTYFLDHIATLERRNVVNYKMLVLFSALFLMSGFAVLAISLAILKMKVNSEPIPSLNDPVGLSIFGVFLITGFLAFLISRGVNSLVIGTSAGDCIELRGSGPGLIQAARTNITNAISRNKKRMNAPRKDVNVSPEDY